MKTVNAVLYPKSGDSIPVLIPEQPSYHHYVIYQDKLFSFRCLSAGRPLFYQVDCAVAAPRPSVF